MDDFDKNFRDILWMIKGAWEVTAAPGCLGLVVLASGVAAVARPAGAWAL